MYIKHLAHWYIVSALPKHAIRMMMMMMVIIRNKMKLSILEM